MSKAGILIWALGIIIAAMLATGTYLWWNSREKSVEELVRSLNDPNPAVRREAAEALGEVGPAAAEAVTALVVTLEDTDNKVRIAAATALARIGDKAIDGMCVALENHDSRIYRGAILAFLALGRSGIPALKKELESDDPLVRQRAAVALAHLDPEIEEAVSPLILALRDSDSGVRCTA